MRNIEKVLCGVGGLIALAIGVISICHFNPGLTEHIKAVNTKTTDMKVANAETLDKKNPDKKSLDIIDINSDYSDNRANVKVQLAMSANDGTNEDTDTLKIPANVIELTGYLPIKSVGTQVLQSTADNIIATLSKGNKGDDLTFEQEIYPYYYMLNDTEKALYRQIYANANDMRTRFQPIELATETEIMNAFTAVVNDQPGLFWVDMAYKYKYSPTGQVVELNLVFNLTATDIEASKIKFDKAVKHYTNTYGLYTDYKKEKTVHNELISNVKYDANAPINQSAYSALVYGRTVCAGYSRAFQYIMQQLDIPCYYVMGYAGENHAWNIIELDNGYYNVDSTWADTNPSTYDYFNCSDKEFEKSHERTGMSVQLPACNASKYSDLEKGAPVIVVDKDTDKPQTDKPQTDKPPVVVAPSQPVADNNTTVVNGTATGNTTTNTTTSTGISSITVQTVCGQGDKGYIDNIEDYYIKCFEKLMATDSSRASFDITVYDISLWDEIFMEYADGRCQDGYIERFLVEKHKNSCQVTVEGHRQSDGSYVLRHYATIN